jgi:hypothetical protein
MGCVMTDVLKTATGLQKTHAVSVTVESVNKSVHVLKLARSHT